MFVSNQIEGIPAVHTTGVTVTGPIAMSASDVEAALPQNRLQSICRSSLTWKIAGAILAITVLLGWICIIALLILKEKWQLVVVAWLLLYAAAHFTYWYFKRNSIFSLHRTVHLSIVEEATGVKADKPPAYADVANTEQPPPPYITIVTENRSPAQIAEVHHPSKAAEAEASASSSNQHPILCPTYSATMRTPTGPVPVNTGKPSPIRPSLADFHNRPSTPSLMGEEPEPSTSLAVPQEPVKKLSTFSSIQNAVEALKSLTSDRD